MKRGKHRRDQNHGKNGMVGGNPRYARRSPLTAKSMGRCDRPRTNRGKERWDV